MRSYLLFGFFLMGCSGADANIAVLDGGGGADGATGDDGSTVVDSGGGMDVTSGSDATDGPSNGCPQGMVRVDGPTPFCIDALEVTVAQYGQFVSSAGSSFVKPNDCSWKTTLHPASGNVGNLPAFNVDWCDAFAYCAWANKRLCGRIGGGGLNAQTFMNNDLAMWSRACTHAGTQPYAYGTMQNPNACRGGQQTPVAVGTMPLCQGGYPGIYDMNGNAQEWEDACEGQGATANCSSRGGDFMDPQNELNCANTFLSQRQAFSARVGFRCCRD